MFFFSLFKKPSGTQGTKIAAYKNFSYKYVKSILSRYFYVSLIQQFR